MIPYLIVAALLIVIAHRFRAKCYDSRWGHIFGLANCGCYERGRLAQWKQGLHVDCPHHGWTPAEKRCAACETERIVYAETRSVAGGGGAVAPLEKEHQ